MLVLSRRKEESIIIDGNIRLIVTEIAGSWVKIGIDAPADVGILRAELTRPRLSRAAVGSRPSPPAGSTPAPGE